MSGIRQILPQGTILESHYRIEEKIGAGGFAITYKAFDTDKDVNVAIKEFYPLDDSVELEHERNRFIHEGKILREFDYLEGIVSVRDVLEYDDKTYLVMDFIEGLTLTEYVREYGAFSWDELVKMVTPVIRSLAKIHRRNVTHCDISPDNLMIGLDNMVWLIDFGASKYVDVKSDRTVIIKQGYAPIEQYYSDGSISDGRIGAWTDVYAFAATMYMALTGEKPRTAVERMKSGEDDKERSALEGILKKWQIDALMKGMSVNKSDRYENMEDFLEGISFPIDDKGDMTRIIHRNEHRKIKAVSRTVGMFLIILVAILLGLLLGRYMDTGAGKKYEGADYEETSATGGNIDTEQSDKDDVTKEKDAQSTSESGEKTDVQRATESGGKTDVQRTSESREKADVQRTAESGGKTDAQSTSESGGKTDAQSTSDDKKGEIEISTENNKGDTTTEKSADKKESKDTNWSDDDDELY